jgi:predicted nucleic acid-binding protein
MPMSIPLPWSGQIPDRGLIDTSVAVALGSIEVSRLPAEMAVSALTLAELAGGPAAATNPSVRADRMERLQRVEATLEALPFDPACARAFGRVCAEVVAAGRKPRGARSVDLMIAATALAHGIPLYTLNAADLRGLGDLVEIVDLG